MVSRWKKSAASSPDACARRKSRQLGVATGRWFQPLAGEDTPDRAGADPVPQTEQLALDAPVPPVGILPGQPHDQILHLVADR
jgi:hypothetical protein